MTTAQANDCNRVTVTLPAELRPLLEQQRRSLEKGTGLRVSLSQAAAALVRRSAEAQPQPSK